MKTLQPHIKCKKGDVGQYAIIPGDPARVRLIAKHFKNPKEIAFNREFLTITGEYKGIRITATSTGIGCPSSAIASNKLGWVIGSPPVKRHSMVPTSKNFRMMSTVCLSVRLFSLTWLLEEK